MFVSDLRHFLDLPDDVAAPARRMAQRLTMIVRAATAGDAGLEWVSALACDRRPARRPCLGHLAVLRTDVPPSIAWRCMSCGDGVISGWKWSLFDLHAQHARHERRDARWLVIPADAAAALRDLQLLDRDTERIVFRAKAHEQGAALLADDDLEELMGCVAAEANHAENRQRQRRLDDVFRILSAALDAP